MTSKLAPSAPSGANMAPPTAADEIAALKVSHAKQVKQLQLAMQEYYKNSKVASRMDGSLTLDRLRTKGQWPKLKAKAAAVRNLIPFVAALARQHNSGSDHDRRRLEIANDLNLFYDTLRSEGQILSRHGAETLRRIGESLPRAYAHLAAEAVGMNKKGWKLVPKFHLFQHILLSQARRLGNPKTWGRWWRWGRF